MGKYSNDKDVDKKVKELIRSGWKLERRGKHLQLESPCGHRCVVSKTPSDRQASRGLERDIKRIQEGRAELVRGNHICR